MATITDTLTRNINDLTALISRQPRSTLAGTALATTTALAAAWLISDYHAWTSFGTGGTPPTPAGYWRMTKLRLARLLAADDLTDAHHLNADAGPRYLPDGFEAKVRDGKRPRIVARTMPQRQHPLPAREVDAGVSDTVQGMMKAMSERYPTLLLLAPAKTEGGAADGIYARRDLDSLNPVVLEPRNRILDGEVAHAHPADGSLHVWLSEGDAKRVVLGGWGERFPLNWVDKGWVMVYAPKTKGELEVVEMIVRAAVGWVTGVKVE